MIRKATLEALGPNTRRTSDTVWVCDGCRDTCPVSTKGSHSEFEARGWRVCSMRESFVEPSFVRIKRFGLAMDRTGSKGSSHD